MPRSSRLRREVRLAVGIATTLVVCWSAPARALVEEAPDPPDPPENVLYARSTDGGRTFHRSRVTDDALTGFPHVVAQGDQVHLAWDVGDAPLRKVRYQRSTDGGRSFLPPRVLSRGLGDSSESDLAVSGDTVHVAWEAAGPGGLRPDQERADDVFLRSSTDGGGRFLPVRKVSRTPRLHTRDPDLALSGELLGVVYEDPVDLEDDVFFRASRDGRTFSRGVNVSRDPDQSAEPVVAISGSTVHVLFEDRGVDELDDDDRVAYARSTDGGRTFSPPVVLHVNAQRRPAIAVLGSTVHVVACQRVLPSELYHLRSVDGGRSWKASRLSDTAGECNKPTIAAHGDRVVVAWQDDTSGEDEILLRRSRDGGRSFGRTVDMSHNAGESHDPSVAIDPVTGGVHLVWIDSSFDGLPRVASTGRGR